MKEGFDKEFQLTSVRRSNPLLWRGQGEVFIVIT